MAAHALRTASADETKSAPSTAWEDWIERGRQVVAAEISVLQSVHGQLGPSFSSAVKILLDCRGKVVVCGMGKAGIVGKKLAASLSSTGTPSHFLHPAEAVHGDLGQVQPTDVVVLLSYSGETEEVTRLLPGLNELAAKTLAITAHAASSLASGVDCAILIGKHPEACSLNLAPSSSTTAMMAVGDALALVTSEQRGFTKERFARYHPGGNLGRRLARVAQIMRPLSECRIARQEQTLRQVMIDVSRPGRRTGAIMLTDHAGRLTGLFTDSDLARLLERSSERQLDEAIENLMTKKIQTIGTHAHIGDAMHILTTHKISELPVVTETHQPVGIIDVTDVLSVMATGVESDDVSDEPRSDDEHDAPSPTILQLTPRRSTAS